MKNCQLAKFHSDRIEHALKGIVEKRFNSSELNSIYKYSQDVLKNSLEPCFKCAYCYDYDFYNKTMQKYFSNTISRQKLNLKLISWDRTKLFDEVQTHFPDPSTKIPSNMEEVSIDKETMYLDQNILSIYLKDKTFKEYVLSLKSTFYQFVYSPSHMEEIFKIKQEKYQKPFIKAITEITDNILCIKNNSRYVFVKESPKYSLDRIKIYDGTTQALEKDKLIVSGDRARYLGKYDTEDHKKRLGEKEDIFNNLEDDEFSELMKHSHTSTLLRKEDFNNVKLSGDPLHAIYTLSYALDLLGYKVDKSERTIRSSLHDIEHLIYGMHANYFVTHDKKFRLRARQIYKFLKVNTVVLSKNSFESKHITS